MKKLIGVFLFFGVTCLELAQAPVDILKYGAIIIQTDQPELLLKALKKRKLHL